MARYRNVSTSFWEDNKIVDDFTPEDKYIYLYCMTNPHTNLCGCYEISLKQIAYETGYNTDSVERLLKRLDMTHEVIRYSAPTKELLIINWDKYNWSRSEKLDKPLLAEISAIKCGDFRRFLAEKYNRRETVTAPYDYRVERRIPSSSYPESDTGTVPPGGAKPLPERQVRHKRGQYGWVRLTDEEMDRLTRDLGPDELARCITYVDEAAQTTGNKNKWKDWNLVIRKCSKGRWGLERTSASAGGTRKSASQGAAEDLRELHELSARGDVVTKKEMTEIFSVMLLAWPNAEMFKGGVAKLGPTIELWAACLSDVDFWTAQQAVIRLCRVCKFPPSIAEFKEQADTVNQDVQSRINLAWNEIKWSRVLDKSPEEWYQGLPPGSDIKAVVDALGGPKGLVSEDGKRWNYYEFRDMYEKLIRKEVPGAVAQLTSGKKKELSP